MKKDECLCEDCDQENCMCKWCRSKKTCKSKGCDHGNEDVECLISKTIDGVQTSLIIPKESIQE